MSRGALQYESAHCLISTASRYYGAFHNVRQAIFDKF